MIELRVLGTLDLQDPDDGDLGSILAQPKLVALLVYLMLARPNGFRPRETLMAMFWPESSESKARRALNQALYRLRQVLGEGVVVSRGNGEVGLDRTRLWCDAEAFEAALESGDREAALELYGGDLLAGFALPGCGEFEAWLDERREGLHHGALRALRERADELAAVGEPVEAAYWLRRALRWDPYDEDVARRLLEQLLAAGDRTGVLREYEAFAGRLAEELGVEPEPELAALAERARANHLAELRQARSEESHTSPAGWQALEARADPAPRRTWRMAIAGLGTLLVAFSGWLLWPERAQKRIPDVPPVVLVTAFENRTDSPALDQYGAMSRDWITQELARTGLVRIIPAADAARPARGGVAPRELARRVEASVLISGSYHIRSDSIVIQASLIDVDTGEVLRAVEVAGPASDGFAALERLRQRTTGALASATDPRLARWSRAASQPPSYEAYRLVSRGIEQFARGDYPDAATSFRQAAEEDPSFLTPVVWEADALYRTMWENPREIDYPIGERADSLVRSLVDRRDDLAPWDLALVEHMAAEEEGDMRASRDALRRMMALAPEDRWRIELARVELWENRPGAAKGLLAEVDPDALTERERDLYYYDRVHVHHRLEEFDVELAAAWEWKADDPDRWMPFIYEIRALAGLGRTTEIAATLAEFEKVRPGFHMFVYRELEIHGQGDLARRQIERDIEWMRRVPQDRRDDLWAHNYARLLYARGEYEDARRVEERRLATMPFSDNVVWTMGLLGRIAVRLGEREEATRYDRMLAETDWSPVWYANLGLWIARERAQIATLLGEHDRAAALLVEGYENGGIYADAHIESMCPDLDGLRDHPVYRRLAAIRG